MTFDDTVARRRAVTYPEAFSTAPGAAPPPVRAVTVAVLTGAASTRVVQSQPPAATRDRDERERNPDAAAAAARARRSVRYEAKRGRP